MPKHNATAIRLAHAPACARACKQPGGWSALASAEKPQPGSSAVEARRTSPPLSSRRDLHKPHCAGFPRRSAGRHAQRVSCGAGDRAAHADVPGAACVGDRRRDRQGRRRRAARGECAVRGAGECAACISIVLSCFESVLGYSTAVKSRFNNNMPIVATGLLSPTMLRCPHVAGGGRGGQQ